ncbi:MAG: hypothetical protein QM691_06030 [Opitutaceae bacterium]
MELGPLRPYSHSGKFGLHALLLVPLTGAALGWPLGLAYAYLIKWIPFVYLNVLLTLGYGLVLGVAVGWVLKRCRVRNQPVAAALAVVVGLAANYFQWSGHVHALLDGAPLLSPPGVIRSVMGFLYEHGSWSLRHGGNVTGWFLGGVWIAEALTILVVVTFLGTAPVRDEPYCEKNGCWLDEQTKYETLAAFTDAQQLAVLKAGDIAPVIDARSREAGSPVFARLLLKHSPRCGEFFTLRVENVTRTTNKKGEVKEDVTALTRDLVLPSELRPLIERFASLAPTSAVVGDSPSPAPSA